MQRRALLVALEAARARARSRVDEIGPGSGREPTVHLLEPREQARDRDGALADVEDLRARVAEVDEELLHLAEAARRHAEEAVEHRRRAARLVHEREAAARRARSAAPP